MPILQGGLEGTVRKIYAKCLAQRMKCHKRSNMIVTFTFMEVPSYTICQEKLHGCEFTRR